MYHFNTWSVIKNELLTLDLLNSTSQQHKALKAGVMNEVTIAESNGRPRKQQITIREFKASYVPEYVEYDVSVLKFSFGIPLSWCLRCPNKVLYGKAPPSGPTPYHLLYVIFSQ